MASTPLTRSACDRCHARKVRCVMSRQQNVCERCHAQNVHCVFSSPGRNGRPPHSFRQAEQSTSESTSSSAAAAASLASANSTSQTDLRDGLVGSTIYPPQLDNDRSTLAHGFPQNLDYTMDDSALYPEFESDGESHANQHHHTDVIMQELLQNSSSIASIVEQPAASGPGSGSTTETIGSLSETMRLLHMIQQRLYEERAVINNSVATASMPSGHTANAPDYGIFFQLIDQMHDILHKGFDDLLSESATQPCDLTHCMSFTTAIATVLEVYELVARSGILMLSPSSSSSLSGGSEVASSASASGRHRSSVSDADEPPTGRNNFRSWHGSHNSIASSCGSAPLLESANSRGKVWVGSFSPSQEISQRILACVLDHQISTSQKLSALARRQFFIQAQGSASLPSSSPQPCYALLQLLEHLQERLAKIKSIALASMSQVESHKDILNSK